LRDLKGWKNREHEPEKRQKYAPESTPQKKTKNTKNTMDVSTPSPKCISRTDAKLKNAQGETSERKGWRKCAKNWRRAKASP
jgi:hypothetical protein